MVKRKKAPDPRIKTVAIYAATIILSIVFIVVARHIAMQGYPAPEDSGNDIIKAKVTEIVSDSFDESNNRIIIFDARALQGVDKGKTISCAQEINYNYYPVLKPIKVGDRVLVAANTYMEGIDWGMREYVRSDKLIWLALIFFAAILVFGRLKGVNTLVALAFTCLAVFAVFIPAVLSGQNIYIWAIVTCIYIIAMTMLVINGASKKSFAAGMGCFFGVLLAGLLTALMTAIMQMTGMVNEDTLFLNIAREGNHIDLLGVIFASITIGAMGAIMDVAMDIASSLNELRTNIPDIDRKRLITSGFNIGRDVMGTMANTLVLAYIGSGLVTTLLLLSYNYSATALFNMELIVYEILQALAGSIGIMLSIPLTSFICAAIYPKRREKAEHKAETT